MKIQSSAFAIVIFLSACNTAISTDEKPAAPEAIAAPTETNASTNTALVPDAMQSVPVEAEIAPPAIAESEDAEKSVNDAIDSNLGDHTRYQIVILALQKAVAAGNVSGVAALVDYPISVEIGGKTTVIKNAETFTARYAKFMTPEISKAIVDTEYKDLFVNAKGVMFGNGQAWVNGICKDNACTTFDVKLVSLQSGPK